MRSSVGTFIKKQILKCKTNYDPIIIFSDPRGGSTWLAEIMNSIPNSFIIWEPLFIRPESAVTKLEFGWRQHIPATEEWHEAKIFFDELLSLKELDAWNLQAASILKLLKSRTPIFKICRGNDLLPWFTQNMEVVIKPIYLLRHPFALAASQLKQGGWDNIPESYVIPQMRFNEKYIKHAAFLKSLSSKPESLVATWCMTNQHRFDQEKWISLFYEDLIVAPRNIIAELFHRLDIATPANIDKKIGKKSHTTVDYSDSMTVNDQLTKWKKFFTNVEIDRMQRVLDYFEIDYYSKDNPLPNKSKIHAGKNHIGISPLSTATSPRRHEAPGSAS